MKIVNKHPRVILASKSQIRKKMMESLGIPFEVIVSDADETPNVHDSFRTQLADISMRKADIVLKQTSYMGKRLIIAADQNIVFDGNMYGKPKTIEDARKLIKSMQGRDDIFAYTGNAVLLVEGDRILESINITDVARMGMDKVSDEILEEYLEKGNPLSKCGGINVDDMNFLHLKEGRYSTACGMTIELAQEMYKVF